MRRTLLGFSIFTALAIGGCTSIKYSPVNLGKNIIISVTEGEMIGTSNQLAYTRLLSLSGELKECHIVLRKYPVCLLHELRHCLEGDWHPRDAPNTEDC